MVFEADAGGFIVGELEVAFELEGRREGKKSDFFEGFVFGGSGGVFASGEDGEFEVIGEVDSGKRGKRLEEKGKRGKVGVGRRGVFWVGRKEGKGHGFVVFVGAIGVVVDMGDFEGEFIVVEASDFGGIFDTDSAGGRRPKSDFLSFCLLLGGLEGGLFFVGGFVGVFSGVAVREDLLVDEDVALVDVGDEAAVPVDGGLGGVVFEADVLVFEQVGQVGFGLFSEAFDGAVSGEGTFGGVYSQQADGL